MDGRKRYGWPRRLVCATALFGFTKHHDEWRCVAPIVGGMFSCVVTINNAGEVSERVVDCATGDEYVQHRVAAAVGAFVLDGTVSFDEITNILSASYDCAI